MKHTHKTTGFTLIEVLIVIGILGMMLTATYAPYSHYQKKALLKQWQKEIVQSIYEARNLAINGLDIGNKNVSVGLYLDTSDPLKNNLTYFGYPYDSTDPGFRPWAFPNSSLVDIIKTKDLPNGIQLEEVEGKDKFLFFFEAITGVWWYYTFDPAIDGELAAGTTNTEIDVNISYKWADATSTLYDTIDYYTQTYIADY